MMFNTIFYNISVISRRPVLLVGDTGENHWHAASHWQPLSHNVVSSTPYQILSTRHWFRILLYDLS
jgi:hypothetical protein